MYQPVANQTLSGLRESWKIVPAVRETRLRHTPHCHTRPVAAVAAGRPHPGHTGPVGQRSQSGYSMQAAAGNHALSSPHEPG